MARWAVAVIRVLHEPGSRGVIRITELTDPLGDEQVLATTASVEEALKTLRDWLASHQDHARR